MKTSELKGPALDWAVAKACGFKLRHRVRGPEGGGFHAVGHAYGYIWVDTDPNAGLGSYGWSPSRKWSDGGPLIEQQKLDLRWLPRQQEWCAYFIQHGTDGFVQGCGFGPTALIAAMRCLVSNKLGDEVEIPTELQGEAQ